MKRKIIKQGLGGFTIYLPKKWVNRKGLKEGEEINIIETESGLVIGSDVKEKKEISLGLDEEHKRNIKNLLTHIYRKGFDKIILKNLDNKTLKKAKKTIKDVLLGFEITEKTPNSIIIENISEPEEQKYDMLLRRVFLIVQENIDLLIKDFEKHKFTNWKEIEELRKEADRYILFCRRIIIKEKYERDSLLEWELLTFLMHIQHAIYYLYKYIKENKIKKNEKLVSLVKNLKSYFDLYYIAYFKNDLKAIHKINRLKKEFHFGKCIAHLEKSEKQNTVIISYLREIYRLIQIGTSPILSRLVEKEIRQD